MSPTSPVGVIIGAGIWQNCHALVCGRQSCRPWPTRRQSGFHQPLLPLSDKVTQTQAGLGRGELRLNLPLDARQPKPAPVLTWGDFVTITLNFPHRGFFVFFFAGESMNALKRHEEANPQLHQNPPRKKNSSPKSRDPAQECRPGSRGTIAKRHGKLIPAFLRSAFQFFASLEFLAQLFNDRQEPRRSSFAALLLCRCLRASSQSPRAGHRAFQNTRSWSGPVVERLIFRRPRARRA